MGNRTWRRCWLRFFLLLWFFWSHHFVHFVCDLSLYKFFLCFRHTHLDTWSRSSLSWVHIMVVMIASLATIGASLMSFGLLAKNRGKIHLSQESLTNSRIEHEENKSITSPFLPTEQKAHDFENGEHKIFVTCGILLFLVTLSFCLFFCGLLWFWWL